MECRWRVSRKKSRLHKPPIMHPYTIRPATKQRRNYVTLINPCFVISSITVTINSVIISSSINIIGRQNSNGERDFTNGWKCGWMGEWMDVCRDGWMDGLVGGLACLLVGWLIDWLIHSFLSFIHSFVHLFIVAWTWWNESSYILRSNFYAQTIFSRCIT